MRKIIPEQRSIIVSADVTKTDRLADVSCAMVGVPNIGALKIGCTSNGNGIRIAVSIIRRELGLDLPIIYDHQKAGNDVPDMGLAFAEMLKDSGVDAAILYPFAGPATQRAWTEACHGAGLEVLVGGVMTHDRFLESEGGYIADSAPERIYRMGCQMGVRDFVVPGTKLEWVEKIRGWLIQELGDGNFVLYAPGFITQGGDISAYVKIAGNECHAIVGRAIFTEISRPAMREAAIRASRALMSVSS